MTAEKFKKEKAESFKIENFKSAKGEDFQTMYEKDWIILVKPGETSGWINGVNKLIGDCGSPIPKRWLLFYGSDLLKHFNMPSGTVEKNDKFLAFDADGVDERVLYFFTNLDGPVRRMRFKNYIEMQMVTKTVVGILKKLFKDPENK